MRVRDKDPQVSHQRPLNSDPGRTCRTNPADSRVGLKISIAYGFNQLLCHFNNLLFPHCKAGGDTEK